MADTAQPSETPKVGDGIARSDSSTKEKVVEDTRSTEAKPSKDADSSSDAKEERDANPSNNDQSHSQPTGSVICDFYAKGWCIKGSSCRFLHVRDDEKMKKKIKLSEGLVEQGQRSEVSNCVPEKSKLMAVNDSGSGVKKQCGSINEFKDRVRPEFGVSLNHSFVNPLYQSKIVEPLTSASVTSTVGLSSNGVSGWTGASLPFSYSSVNMTRLDALSPSLNNGSFRKLTSTKRKLSSGDWEPSEPFRPSKLLLSMISISGSLLYDPLRDSVVSPKVGDASVEIHQNVGLACNNDTLSVSSHNTKHGKDNRAVNVDDVMEVVGTSTGVEDYNTTLKLEKSLGSSAVKDVTEATSDVRPQNQGSGTNVAVKSDIRNNYQTKAGSNPDQTVHKESREMRHFRAALIEYVKELLKPKWLDGQISKATHNKIVKKTVEKVLSSLPLDQVPGSVESTEKYLAASRGKIDKLIEGYEEIYRKILN